MVNEMGFEFFPRSSIRKVRVLVRVLREMPMGQPIDAQFGQICQKGHRTTLLVAKQIGGAFRRQANAVPFLRIAK